MAELLARKRGARNPMRLPSLTLDQVWEWAELHFQRTGRWPTVQERPDRRCIRGNLERGGLGVSTGQTWTTGRARSDEVPYGATAAAGHCWLNWYRGLNANAQPESGSGTPAKRDTGRRVQTPPARNPQTRRRSPQFASPASRGGLAGIELMEELLKYMSRSPIRRCRRGEANRIGADREHLSQQRVAVEACETIGVLKQRVAAPKKGIGP